jgi:hypothetical protein
LHYVYAWRVVAQQLYPGETFKYPGNPKVRFSYEGMLVKCKGAVCVLAGPELELKPLASSRSIQSRIPSAPASRKSNAYD